MDGNAIDKHDPCYWINIIKQQIGNDDPYGALGSLKKSQETLHDFDELRLIKYSTAMMILDYARAHYMSVRNGILYAPYRLRYYKYLRLCRITDKVCRNDISGEILEEALSLRKREYYPKILMFVARICMIIGMSLILLGVALSINKYIFIFRQLPLILMITSFLVSIFGKMPKWKINKHIIEGRESLRSKIGCIFQEIAELSKDLMGLLCNLIATIIGFALFALLCAGPCYLLYLAIPYVMREIRDLLCILLLIGIIQSIFGVFDAIFGGLSSLGWLFLLLFLDSSESNHGRW